MVSESHDAVGKTNENGVYIGKEGIKTFIPLENNPEVFTSLVHTLGLSNKLGFYDVYSIDEPDLLALIPRPAHALIFISPANIYNKVRKQDGRVKPDELEYTGYGEEEPVLWFRQTIGNACGLIALIHSVTNGSAKQYVQPDSVLDRIMREALPLKPSPRANVLYNSQPLEEAHMAAARQGDSAAPMAEEPVGYHFISFVKGTDGHLWELEGSTYGPIDCGALEADEDVLSKKALDIGPGRFVKAAEGSLEFSIIGLTNTAD